MAGRAYVTAPGLRSADLHNAHWLMHINPFRVKPANGDGGNGGGARPRPAGFGQTRAALPNAQMQRMIIAFFAIFTGAGKADIGFFRK